MATSAHFFYHELACPCCGFNFVRTEILRVAEAIRKCAGPLRVTSGYRCPAHNADVGGSPTSQHMYGRALDIQSSRLTPRQLFELIVRLHDDGALPLLHGLGLYTAHVHIDARATKGLLTWKNY